MSLLQKECMVKGLSSSINETPHEICIVGKQQRDSFKSASYRAKYCLELVHIDLCGPMQNQSIGGSFYFWHLLMILARKFGFNFSNTNHILSHISNISRLKQSFDIRWRRRI